MSENLKKAAISELRAWKKGLTTDIKLKEKALAEQLRAAAPESFGVWLRTTGATITDDLIKHGTASHKYLQGEGGLCYNDLTEFNQRFEDLKIAWEGVVRIIIFQNDPRSFTVIFVAV